MSIETLDLNLLRVLHTVLTEGSVASAARRLHVTPSAVSNALARLRDALHDPLVTRRGRGIVPSSRAALLAPILARALGDLGSAVDATIFDPTTTTRRFTLAIADVGQVVHGPRIATLFAEAMPRATLRIVGIASLVSLGGLAGVDVDVSIGVAMRTPVAGLHQRRLFDEPMTLVARAGHPLASRRLRAASFADLRHVAVEMVPGKAFADPVAAAYTAAGLPRAVGMIVPTFGTAAAIVAATDHVTDLPISMLAVLGPSLGLRAARGDVPVHGRTMTLSWHERTHRDPAMVAFRTLLRRAVTLPSPRERQAHGPSAQASNASFKP